MAIGFRGLVLCPAGSPRELFQISASVSLMTIGRNYDVTADGQRFLMVQGSPGSLHPQIVVVPRLREELHYRKAATTR